LNSARFNNDYRDRDDHHYYNRKDDEWIDSVKNAESIAVEIKSFVKPSSISKFHTAVGQYLNYRRALRAQEPNRVLYLAVPSQTYNKFFRLRFIQEGVEEYQIYLLVSDIE
jgi:XisH protein